MDFLTPAGEDNWDQVPMNKKFLQRVRRKMKEFFKYCEPRPNVMYNLHELTCTNMEDVLCNTEISGARFLLSLGFQLYYVTTKEDAQWCDILCWSPTKREWCIVELKCNTEDSLFNEYGRFIRLGAFTTYCSLIEYFQKGMRLNTISEHIGIGKIMLIYEGKLRPRSEKGFYNIIYGENGIRNVMRIEDSL